ncbi:MAG: hypothetical protein ILO34_06100, partial [Kiritimatiellae bacterium]|nr:hypothetical protein [Kiritimatiellia bacterium]
KTAVQTGLSLAQTGEFAFLVALLYLAHSGDPSSPMYQIAAGVSLLTTATNPLILKISDPAGEWIERRCPEKMAKLLDAYRPALARLKAAVSGGGEGVRKIRAAITELGVMATLEFAVAFSFSLLNGRDWSEFSEFFDGNKRFIFCLAMNVISVGMFVAVVVVARRLGGVLGAMLAGTPDTKWRQAVDGMVRLATLTAAVGLFFLELAMINVNLAPSEPWARWVIAAVFAALALVGWRFFAMAGRRAVTRLNEALAADSRPAADDGETRALAIPSDAFGRLTVREGSPAIGETVVSLNIRAKTGASVVSLERDGETMGNPGPETRVRAGDTLGVMGEREQVEAARKLLGEDNG